MDEIQPSYSQWAKGWGIVMVRIKDGTTRAKRSPTVGFLLLQHFCYFLLSSPNRCFISYSFDFYVLGDVAQMS